MILEKLSILNYKNIAAADLSFSPNVNCLLGDNGMGKTNLLDAIYYLSFCKSFGNLPDSQQIRRGEEFFVLQGTYREGEREEELYCGLKRRQKKQFKRNKKEYERLSDHIGFIPLVMVSPADSELIAGGSEERRRFLDLVIAQFDKPYLEALIRYNKALVQRNTLLKLEQPPQEETIGIWEAQMERYGRSIYEARRAFLERFKPYFAEFYKEISCDNEQVEIGYDSDAEAGPLTEQLRAVRERDRILGHTTKGVHRDDLRMEMDGYPMKRIGSQGQNKTFLIALKLAQFAFLQEEGHTEPILLLDDIFDKLDARRVARLVGLAASERFGQIFITDTNRNYLDRIIEQTGEAFRLFEVTDGEITPAGEGAQP